MTDREETVRQPAPDRDAERNGQRGADPGGFADQPTERLGQGRQDTIPDPAAFRPDQTAGYPVGYLPPGVATAGTAAGATTGPPAPGDPPRPAVPRRADPLAALLLLVAGLSAALSLPLRWVAGEGTRGLDLVRRGLDEISLGLDVAVTSGSWQPPAVVLGGGVLALLGLLLLVPARRRQALALLALAVSAVISAAVLIPLWRAGWDLDEFALGFRCALAVAVLGLLGTLKALLTAGPRRDDAG